MPGQLISQENTYVFAILFKKKTRSIELEYKKVKREFEKKRKLV